MHLSCIKCLCSTFVLCSLFFVPITSAHAQDFSTSYNASYTLSADGSAEVVQEITLRNNVSTTYAPVFTLTLQGKKPREISAFQDKESLNFELKESGADTQIIVTFPKAVVGRDRTRAFTISYKVDRIAQKNGEVWEVSVPKIAKPELINDYNLSLNIPTGFGKLSYLWPEPKGRSLSQNFYAFEYDKESLQNSAVAALFGEFQVYNLALAYHLENPSLQRGEVEIALPPDTAFQRVYYDEIVPAPKSINLDNDGNWIGVYELSGNEKLAINVRLKVQVFAKPQSYYSSSNPLYYPFYLSSTDKWQVNDSQILNLASRLKTPRSVYDFVVSTLNYDYTKINTTSSRLGAKEALENPQNAICTEYADLFVALSRASGIPAREVEGYAYTNNPALQPLSLVSDILHAWPEYWDSVQEVWKPVDPTWEDTTGGVNYFDKFDLSHIAFAIHGKNYNYPYPAGSYRKSNALEKDVQVELGTLPEVRTSSSLIQIVDDNNFSLPFVTQTKKIRFTNSGTVALYNLPLDISGEGIVIAETGQDKLEFLAPHDVLEVLVKYKIPFSLAFTPLSLKVIVGESSLLYDFSEIKVYGSQILAVFLGLLLLLISIFSIFHTQRLKK